MVGVTAGVGWAKTTHKVKPAVTSALSSSSIPLGSTATDTATVAGKAGRGSPTGSVTFGVCGPTATAKPCTSPNAGSAIVGLSTGTHHRSTAIVTLVPGAPGWYCFLDQYNGDANYKTASDNDTATECLDVTNGTGTYTPTLKSSLSSSSIPFGDTAVDTAVVTGNSTAGSPTGSVTFGVCGPTAAATPCTSANVVATATVVLTSESGDRSTTAVTVNPGSPGWFCFLDQYNGDAHYKVVTDNDTATECIDVTNGTGTYTPTLTSSLSSSSIRYGATDVDTATVTGNSTAGSPTGSVTFGVCGPTAAATPCTSANVVATATAGLSPESGDRAVTDVTVNPGTPGWFCLLDQYNGDANYKVVTDNDTTTECFDATNTASAAPGSDGATSVTPAPAGARGRSTSTTLTPLT
ncbi:MAG TPA: hypothetical protein VN816_09655 [Acidimicrobiales bacterium]|nr:hypothetical protein [Acidimicrobiales bacterium]